MKEGWEVKKLTDLCSIQYGCAFESSLFSTSPEDGMPLIRIRDVNEGHTSTYYKGSYSSEYIIRKGDYLIGMDGEFNIEPWQSEDALLNQRVCKIESKCNVVSIRYIYRFLKKELKRIEDDTPFVTVKHLSAKRLNQIQLPLPPLPEQEKIVAELDCLSGIIEKKKQQLKELDALAQSIFYEMFGDPVENEKGWEVKKLGEVSEVTSFKRVLIEDVVECGVPFIRGTELSALSKLTNSKNFPFTLFITPEHYERVKAISGVPTVGDLLIPSINSEGVVWVLDTDEPRYYKDGRVLWVHTNHQYNESIALKYIISNKLRLMYKELASGATFIELKLFVLREMELPFPPLSLQHSFASKVEAIERQKELIKQSISETETLFNARMQHYFN